MAVVDGRPAAGIYLNGATIMTTRTDRHIEVARAAGFDGVEVRAERLLDAPDEVREAAAIVRPGEVWSLNGIQLQLGPDGRLDRTTRGELLPRLEACRSVRPICSWCRRGHRAPNEHRRLPRCATASPASATPPRPSGGHGLRVPASGLSDRHAGTRGRGRVSRPGRRAVLDSCHWHASGRLARRFPVDRLAMVHLNDAPAKPPREIEDADRVLPGAGVIRLTELVADLHGRGYRGPWSLETFNPAYWADDPMRSPRPDSSPPRPAGPRPGQSMKIALRRRPDPALHARLVASQPDVSEVIVADVDPRRAQEPAEAIGGRTAAAGRGAGRGGRCIVTATTDAHPDLVSMALDRAFRSSAKPLALELDVTIDLVERSSGSPRSFQIGFQRRFDPAYVEARRLVENGGPRDGVPRPAHRP